MFVLICTSRLIGLVLLAHGLVCLLACSPAAAGAAEARPNVVVVLADDLGWGDLSFNGNVNLRTPQVDSLARDGAHFERFFVQPVCAPTRAEFLTGRYHPRGGVHGVSTGSERLDLDETTIAEAFQAAGYATACFGKWHNGSQYPYHPNGRGFEEYYGFTSGHWGDYFSPPLDHNGQPVQGDGYLADDFTARAIQFMQRNLGEGVPFFCYVAYNTPHSPMQAPEEYWERFATAPLSLRGTRPKRERLEHTRAALAMCENLDDNVGRILTALEERQATDDTIVVFFSDNGPNGHRWNGGMKGIKGDVDEGGVRSPLFIRWPKKIDGGRTVKSIAGAVDLYPTLAGLAGVATPTAKPLDGMDLSPLLAAAPDELPDRMLFQHWAGKTSVRTQTRRLDAAGKLYDMENDPAQTSDISAQEPEAVRRLAAAVIRWRREVLAELPAVDDRPFPVGVGPGAATVLPARDGRPQGGVKRSSAAPNCSYFTNWTSRQDGMSWDVEVAGAGRYEAILAYTCAAENVGATVELAFREARWSGKVDVAHDPPLRGREHDRAPRTSESYVKEFRRLSLGVVELEGGRGMLRLRAIDIPGREVADVQSVTLVRQD